MNLANAFRDCVICAIGKGQLLPLLLGASLVIVCYSFPEEAWPSVIHRLFDIIEKSYLLGWVICFIVVIFWRRQVRSLHRAFDEERKRIGKEKTDLQQQLVSKSLGTSDY